MLLKAYSAIICAENAVFYITFYKFPPYLDGMVGPETKPAQKRLIYTPYLYEP